MHNKILLAKVHYASFSGRIYKYNVFKAILFEASSKININGFVDHLIYLYIVFFMNIIITIFAFRHLVYMKAVFQNVTDMRE